MLQKFFPLLLCLFTFTANAQSFEGKITYQNTYKSKLPNITDKQWGDMMGSKQEYYIKEGAYKSVMNGTVVQWQVYINKENRLYSKTSMNDAALWNDGSINPDEVLSTTLNKDAVSILGYPCDELVLTCKSGVQKYYFSTTLAVDLTLYANHKYGNWADFISRSKALPLKVVVDNAQFTSENLATEVKPMQLDATFFALPPNIKTVKNPN